MEHIPSSKYITHQQEQGEFAKFKKLSLNKKIIVNDTHYLSPNESYDYNNTDLYELNRESNTLELNMSTLLSSTPMISTPNGTEKRRPNLLRENTTTKWNDSDIDDMTNDMKQQLNNLSSRNLDTKMFSDRYDPNGLTLNRAISNIYRQKSEENWNDDDIDDTFDEMRKELKYLTKRSLSSISLNKINLDRES